jgi:hypothetical protein
VCRNAQLFTPLITESESFLQNEAKSYQVMEVLVDEGLLQVNIPLNKSYSVDVEDTAYTSTDQWTNLTWVIDNITCQAAKQHRNNYACISSNSVCVNINGTNWGTLGYRCRCNPGYRGNPYVANGCEGTLIPSSLVMIGMLTVLY